MVTSSFSIYAYEALKKELNNIKELRFIFSSPTFIEENFKKHPHQFYIPHIYKETDLCGGEFELRLKNKLNQRAIAQECSKWVKDRITFKSNKHHDLPMTGLIHVRAGTQREAAYANVNSFKTADLGTTQKKGFLTLMLDGQED